MSKKQSTPPGWRLPISVKVDKAQAQEDGRRLAISAITAGLLGAILQNDILLLTDAVMLMVVGVLIWFMAFIEPATRKEQSNGD